MDKDKDPVINSDEATESEPDHEKIASKKKAVVAKKKRPTPKRKDSSPSPPSTPKLKPKKTPYEEEFDKRRTRIIQQYNRRINSIEKHAQRLGNKYGAHVFLCVIPPHIKGNLKVFKTEGMMSKAYDTTLKKTIDKLYDHRTDRIKKIVKRKMKETEAEEEKEKEKGKRSPKKAKKSEDEEETKEVEEDEEEEEEEQPVVTPTKKKTATSKSQTKKRISSKEEDSSSSSESESESD